MSKSLSRRELRTIQERITEIGKILDACNDSTDSDVIEALDREQDALLVRLEKSHSLAKRKEIGLHIIKGDG